jgi:SRSO17 transposase
MGKVENCQASVMMVYASQKGFELVDHQLYMPKKGSKRGICRLGKGARCQPTWNAKTRTKYCLPCSRKSCFQGIGFQICAVDCTFGSDSKFLNSPPEGVVYFTDIGHDSLVFEVRPEIIVSDYKGRGR